MPFCRVCFIEMHWLATTSLSSVAHKSTERGKLVSLVLRPFEDEARSWYAFDYSTSRKLILSAT